ncbi:hypothetical protein EVG20_g11617, partial [Dentipellis fragilis]
TVKKGKGKQKAKEAEAESGDEEGEVGEEEMGDAEEAKETVQPGGSAFVELHPHHWEDLRGQAEAKTALLGRGWFHLKRESTERGPLSVQAWNPRTIDKAAVGKLVKSYTTKGVESWKSPIDLVVRREWLANVEDLGPETDTWQGMKEVKIAPQFLRENIKIAAGQHRFEALQLYEEAKEKKRARDEKAKAELIGDEEEENEGDKEYVEGQEEMEVDEGVGEERTGTSAYYFICRFWDLEKVEANGGRIGMHISQNRNRPEKEESEAERFLIGLTKARNMMDAERERLGRELTVEERNVVTNTVVGSMGVSRGAESLLKTAYIVDIASEMRSFGNHFINWENFTSSRVKEMFVGTHGRMLAAIGKRGLKIWSDLIRPVKFEKLKTVKDLADARVRLREFRPRETKAEFAGRKMTVSKEEERIQNMLNAGVTVTPMHELMLSSPFLTDVGIAYVETIGNPTMMTRLGMPRGEDAEYDEAYDKYVDQVVSAVTRCVKDDMFAEEETEEAELMKSTMIAKTMFVLDQQRDGVRPQMPLLTTHVVNHVHDLLSSVDESVAERVYPDGYTRHFGDAWLGSLADGLRVARQVIRWWEPAFDISRANMSKDGWKDRSDSLYSWMKNYSNEWEGGLDNAFEEYVLWAQICLCIFAFRRKALEPMLYTLHMTKCKFIDRP